MGKLLNAIASQLSIRSNNENVGIDVDKGTINTDNKRYIYNDVPEKTRAQFKRVFHQHMYRKLSKMKVGDSLNYMFDCGNDRPLSLIMDDANQNLAEVLQKLPELPEGESYAFPPNSCVEITLMAKMGKRLHIKINLVSNVFVEAGL